MIVCLVICLHERSMFLKAVNSARSHLMQYYKANTYMPVTLTQFHRSALDIHRTLHKLNIIWIIKTKGINRFLQFESNEALNNIILSTMNVYVIICSPIIFFIFWFIKKVAEKFLRGLIFYKSFEITPKASCSFPQLSFTVYYLLSLLQEK